jgi:hypothetical protein
MIESFHYRERRRTRLLEMPPGPRIEKVLYRFEKKRVQFLSDRSVRASKGIEERDFAIGNGGGDVDYCPSAVWV